jgi:hypothetical protein
MVEVRHEPVPVEKKRPRRKAGERLPPLGLKPLDPEKRLLKPRLRKTVNEWMPAVSSDLGTDFPVTSAELDAILQLLGDDLKVILE